jgi:error-prone DNA polymerase
VNANGASPAEPAYAELHCLSNFSFLRGASHPEELVEQAAAAGYAALAITDHESLAGIVRAHTAAKERQLHLLIGAEITPVDGPPLVLLATDRPAYGRLARLITRGRLRMPKGQSELTVRDVLDLCEGLIGIALPPANLHDPLIRRSLDLFETYRDAFADRLYLAAELTYDVPDSVRLAYLADLSRRLRIPLVAANDVHYHTPQRRYLQDVLTCIRHQCTLTEAGSRLFANAERHLRPRDEMARRYAGYEDALARTIEIANRCTFTLDELRYEYPHELCPPGVPAMKYLADLTWAGAAARYPDGLPDGVRSQLERELALIAELRYEHYFLTVWDLVRFARSRGILCQGRGSAANSAVCYCLGVTAVDPNRIDVLFERFISRERNEPPDIDIDFEHERREEVFQYIYNKYGRERAGITAEVITYRPRSAARDVGKVLGLSLDRVDALAKSLDWWDIDTIPPDALAAAGLKPEERTVQMLIRLVVQLLGFPRHLSQHVGGFVITETPLCEIVPLENGAMPERTFIEWDKDDIDALGLLKVDCLALGMLTAINKCFGLLSIMRDQGIEGSRDPEEEEHGNERTEERKHERAIGNAPGEDDVSGTDRLGEGGRVGESGLPADATHACRGAFRPDNADAARGSVGREQYRRGQRTLHARRLLALLRNRARFAGRTGDSNSHCSRARNDGRGTHKPLAQRNQADSAGTDKQSPAKGICHSARALQKARQGAWASQRVRRNAWAGQKAGFRQKARARNLLIPRSLDPLIPCSLSEIPAEDPAVYDMICQADTVGVFQIESRAQMSMLPRLKPRQFYDLVIEVAIVRPGPIQGGMVHPYLRRRAGLEAVEYPSEAVKGVLQKTLGVPLFQEQVMRVAMVAAGFTAGEADQLRRAMSAWRRHSALEQFKIKLIRGMLDNGYGREFAEQIYKQIHGFGEYGFPESHAASFALLAYASAWLKRYHPAAFCAALLNSQPMGFYSPGQLIRDAIAHGVRVLPVDVNYSGWDCSLEFLEGREEKEGSRDLGIKGSRDAAVSFSIPRSLDPLIPSLRLGLRLVRGLSAAKVAGIEAARREGPITSIRRLARRPDVARDTLVRLAAADAFRSLGLQRRAALWQILALDEAEPPLFAELEPDDPAVPLPPMPLDETVFKDYQTTGFSLNAHPLELIRSDLQGLGVTPNGRLRAIPNGTPVRVAGLVTVRQRPSTARGIVFMTLEDESGSANLVVHPPIWERDQRVARARTALLAEGHVERQGEVVHVIVRRLHDLSHRLASLTHRSRDFQ